MSDEPVVRADPPKLTRVAGLLSRGADDLRSGLNDVDAEVSRMLDEWRGSSGGVYGSAWRQWHEGAARIQAGLSLMATLLRQAGDGYQHQESASTEALRGVPR
jgi:WXG100 family type VII secretion target